jgi:hypothetical protein
MTVFLSPDQITGAADGCVRAEEARRLTPRSPASSGIGITDEAPGVVASVERVNAWLEVARAGDRFVYATRAFLPVAAPGAARMRALSDRGLVMLVQPRSSDNPTLFCYTAVRTTVPSAAARPVRERLSARVIDAEAALIDALLPVLERAARFGRPCPTDHQLAQKSGLAIAKIPEALDALVLAGLIRVFAAPRPTLRRVVIVGSGHQTGLVAA